MPDNEVFQVKIITPVELSGAKALEEQLQRDIGKAKALGEDFSQLQTKLKSVQAAIANADIPDASEREKRSLRETREELRLLSAQAGPLGEIIRTAFSPELVGLAAFMSAIEGVRAMFAALQKQVDDYNESMRAIDAAKAKALADTTHDAAKAAADFAAAQAKLDDESASADKLMAARIKTYNDQVEAVQKVNEAQEKAFEAEIDRRASLGQITKEQAESAKSRGRLDLDAARGAIDQAKLQNEIDERQRQLDEANRRLQNGSDQRPIETANAARKSSAAAASDYDAQIKYQLGRVIQVSDIASGNIEELKKQAQELREIAEENEEGGTGTDPQVFRAQAAAVEDAIRSQESFIANLQTLKDRQDAAADAAKRAADTAREREAVDCEIVRSGPDQIAELQRQAELQKRTQAQVQNAPAGASKDADAYLAPPTSTPGRPRPIDASSVREAAGYGGGRQDTFGAQIRSSIATADAAITHAEHGMPGAIAVLSDKVTHMAALLRRATSSRDHDQLQRAIDKLQREITALSSRQSVNRAN